VGLATKKQYKKHIFQQYALFYLTKVFEFSNAVKWQRYAGLAWQAFWQLP